MPVKMGGKQVVKRPTPSGRVQHLARHPICEMPDHRCRQLRRRHHQILRRGIRRRHQTATPPEGAARSTDLTPSTAAALTSCDRRTQIPFERDNNRVG